MEIAQVHYAGRSRRHVRTAPTGRRYRFTRTTSGHEDYGEVVTNVEDALYFDREDVFDVEWTKMGAIAKRVEGPVTEIESMLAELGYREKQQMAKALGLKASGAEEELDKRLEPAIEELQQEMEVP